MKKFDFEANGFEVMSKEELSTVEGGAFGIDDLIYGWVFTKLVEGASHMANETRKAGTLMNMNQVNVHLWN